MSWLNDTTRAALMLVITNAFSVAVLFGLNVSGEQVAGATSFINSAVILLMLVVKSGQSST